VLPSPRIARPSQGAQVFPQARLPLPPPLPTSVPALTTARLAAKFLGGRRSEPSFLGQRPGREHAGGKARPITQGIVAPCPGKPSFYMPSFLH